MVGLVARPTGGVIDFASGTFDSVKRVTENQEEIKRTRPSRFLHSDGIVRNYNLKEAQGWKYLRELDKGKYAKTDIYVAHENVAADAPSVLMVSNKRILFMSYQSVLGNWTTAWEFVYADITIPATGRVNCDSFFCTAILILATDLPNIIFYLSLTEILICFIRIILVICVP